MAMATCEGTLDTDKKIIISPNYPSNYPHNALCKWSIRTTVGKQLVLNVEEFTTESSDRLEILDSKESTASIIDRIQEKPAHTNYRYTSRGHELFLRFTSDASVTYKGFLLHFTAKVEEGKILK